MSLNIVQIATLNCRGLPKTGNPAKFRSFSRYLRSLNIDIFSFQETHAHSDLIKQSLNISLQTKSSIWTPHCGIVSLNPNILLSSHPDISRPDGRFILASVASTASLTTPIFYILNIYAPAESSNRVIFFQDLIQDTSLMTFLRSNNLPILMMGDFNYDQRQPGSINSDWLSLLRDNFDNCFMGEPLPTFTSTRGTHHLLDYSFCSIAHSSRIRSPTQEFVNYAWTDHNLLSVSFRTSTASRGPGAWKANPMLAKIPTFRSSLIDHLLQVIEKHQYLSPACILSEQATWDALKVEVKGFAKAFQLDRNSWRTKSLKKLQSKRNRIFRQYRHTAIWSTLLPSLEKLISSLQTEIAEISALQAGKYW
ncbi:Endonuclease/exonuclease/phosphatase, partial [Blakeslea trispora]